MKINFNNRTVELDTKDGLIKSAYYLDGDMEAMSEGDVALVYEMYEEVLAEEAREFAAMKLYDASKGN